MKLYDSGLELQLAIEQLSAMVESGDMTPEEMSDNLAAIDGEFEQKIDSCLYHLKNLQARSDALKTGINGLQAKKKTTDRQVEQFKDYLKACLSVAGKKKAGTGLFSVSLVIGRETAVIDDEGLLDDVYVTVDTIIKTDNKKILADLKTGPVSGAHIERGEPSVRIK